MLALRYAKQASIRAFLSPLFFNYSTTGAVTAAAPNSPPSPALKLQAEDVAATFREWFRSGRSPFLDRIYEILSSSGGDGGGDGRQDEEELLQRRDSDAALSRLNLRLNEALVLDVLRYGNDVLSCLKFFDWAGRQPGFRHTRATFNAIFKILKRAKLKSLMLDYLDNYAKHRESASHFYNVLVMGYAVAGKLEIALQLFGQMRYRGMDLDGYSYHVLLNALVEEDCFDAVEAIASQIKIQGLETEVTHSILVKSFCRKREFDKAETYISEVMKNGVGTKGGGYIVGALVDGLCKNGQFDKAGKLVEEFGEFRVYDIWIRELVQAKKLDGAMEFLQKSRNGELVVGYVPDVFRYNKLIWRLLRDNKLEEVYDLVLEMKENGVPPDESTMNILLCFFCKAGMADVALDLYNSRGELGLSLSSMAFNYLINTLCGEGSVVDAYRILKNSIEQGYFPGKHTLSILADAFCKMEKLDMMNELFLVALDTNIVLSDKVYENYITALCRAGRVEDGYLIHGELNRLNKVSRLHAYVNLINGLIKSKRGDIAARLLIEMQEKGHIPNRRLFTTVVQSVCEMENPEKQFQNLLEMQLSRHEANCDIFNYFIEGASLAKKPEMAREVYEMMGRSGIPPSASSDILTLRGYLNSEKVSDALYFFYDISKKKRIGRRICNAMVVGLCRANKPDIALGVFSEIRQKENTIRLSLQCYEELLLALCKHKRYDKVVDLIDDLIQIGRPVSSFIGTHLLLHAMKSRELYSSWVGLRSPDERSLIWRVGELIALFSDRIRHDVDIDDLEEVVQKCFRLDINIYNMLLRKLCMERIDDAVRLFHKICQKGIKPNQWTYENMVHGLYKHGRKTDVNLWVEEMLRRGFNPSEITKVLL